MKNIANTFNFFLLHLNNNKLFLLFLLASFLKSNLSSFILLDLACLAFNLLKQRFREAC